MPLNWKIPVGCVEMGPPEFEQVQSVLESGWVSPGPKVAEFEQKFAHLHDCKYGVMVNSGTDALRIALATLKEVHGWKDGDEVIVPALTFVATVNIILQNGMKPVFVDVMPDDFNIDFTQIKAVCTPRTRAIIPVHMFGQMADISQFESDIRALGLKIIEDSCETIGTRRICNWGSETGHVCGGPETGSCRKSVGSFGDIACFSTYACHVIVTGVGGVATTNNPQYAEVMRSYANHGRDPFFLGGGSYVKAAEDPKELIQKRFLYHRVGYSSRCSEFEAAMGIAQLDRLPQILKKRAENAKTISDLLQFNQFNGVSGAYQLPQTIPVNREHAFMMYPILLKNPVMDRDDFCLELEKRGIETRPLMPLLTQPVYQDLFGDIAKNYPVAYEATTRGFYVGCHQKLTQSDMEYMTDCIRSTCNELILTDHRKYVAA